MFKALLSFCLTRRPVVLAALMLFIGAGIAAFVKLNIEAYPNPAPVILEITSQAPGLSAEEMEKYYTIPTEIGLYSTPGIDTIRSTSFYGLSFVRVTFKYGVPYYFAYTQAALSLQQNVSLPQNQVPQIQQSSLVGEVFRYQIVGPPHIGLTNLRTIQDWVVLRRLSTVHGVVQVNSWGGTTKEFDVAADLPKLQSFGVTVPQLIQALGNSNINVGGREIAIGQQSVNIRGLGLIDDGGNDDLLKGYRVDDIGNVVLTQANGITVRVKDVARVYVGNVPRLGIAGRDHQDDIVAAIVVMGREEHTNDVVPLIKAEIDRMNSDGSLPPGVHIVPYYDRTTLVNVTTHTVLHNLVFGCILVFLIQWIFLGDLRSAIVVGANIPFALLFSIMLLVLRGEDANLLSVGAVDFGIIIDSAVIMVENIFRNLQLPRPKRNALVEALHQGAFGPDPTAQHQLTSKRAWNNPLRIVLISALQVDHAILFSAAIMVAAFVPLFTMQGVEGQIFGPMARTYAYALAGALIASFTVTPVLLSVLLPSRVQEVETIFVRTLRRGYTPVLRWALNRRRIVLALAAVFLVGCGVVATNLGSEFLPALEEGNFWIRASLPPTLTLDAGTAATRKIREILLQHKEVITVVSQHGRPDNGSDASPFSNVELFVPLKNYEQWPAGLTKDKLTAELQDEFSAALPGVNFNFSQYIQDNVEEAISGVKGANSVKIIGPNLAVLEDLATKVRDQMATVPGVADLGIFHLLGQPNLNVRIDRVRAARYGLNTGDINTTLQAALGGTVATNVLEGDRSFNLTVRLADKYRDSLEKINNLPIAYQPQGGGPPSWVPLREVADVSLDSGASYIYHEKTQRYIPIKFSVRGRDLGSTVAEAQRRITETIHLPTGYRLVWAGEFDDLKLAQARLSVIVPVSLLIIVVLLYSLFNSLRSSLLALTGIPFAVGGGIIALAVAGLPFSISAAIGFISLFGVSVMNGILVITYYNSLRAAGQGTRAAMFTAAEQRMRPMLMTALSACIGLFPAALSTGIGSQVQRPLATVVVGGMLIGPLMLLAIVPALQLLILGDDRSEPIETAADGVE